MTVHQTGRVPPRATVKESAVSWDQISFCRRSIPFSWRVSTVSTLCEFKALNVSQLILFPRARCMRYWIACDRQSCFILRRTPMLTGAKTTKPPLSTQTRKARGIWPNGRQSTVPHWCSCPQTRCLMELVEDTGKAIRPHQSMFTTLQAAAEGVVRELVPSHLIMRARYLGWKSGAGGRESG